MSIQIKSVTYLDAVKGLEEIFCQLQTDFHDQWDWLKAGFFVDVLKAEIERRDEPPLQPKDVLRDEPSAPTLQQVISVLEWASAGDWEHAMDCAKEALSLLAQLSPVPPSPDTMTRPALTEDGNGNKTHYHAEEVDAFIERLEYERDVWRDKCKMLGKPEPSEGLIKEAEETMKEDAKFEAWYADNDMGGWTEAEREIAMIAWNAGKESLAPVEATGNSVEMIYEANLWEKHSTEEKLLLCDLTRRVMDEDQFSAALNEFLNEISPKVEATGSETPTEQIETVLTSEGRQIVWAIFNNDGCECSDFVGVFGTEDEAKTVAERVEKGIRAWYAKEMGKHEWMGSVTIRQFYLNEYELPADVAMGEELSPPSETKGAK